MATPSRTSSMASVHGRGVNNLVSERTEPQRELADEGDASGHGSTRGSQGIHHNPDGERRIQAIEGTLQTLNTKFDKLMEEMINSRRGMEFPQNPPSLMGAPSLISQTIGLPPPLFPSHIPQFDANISHGNFYGFPVNSHVTTHPLSTPLPTPFFQSPLPTIPTSITPVVPASTFLDNLGGRTQVQGGGIMTSGNRGLNKTNSNNTLRLKLPEFDGESDVEEWLMRAKRYFKYYEVIEEDRLKACSVQLKGKASYWFDWIMKIREDNLSWEEFCVAIKRQFGPSHLTDYMIDLKWLKQDYYVQEYDIEFQKMSQRVQGISEKGLVSQYIGGLKEEIRYEVQISKPEDLPTAMQLAKLYEAKLNASRKPFKSSFSGGKSSSYQGGSLQAFPEPVKKISGQVNAAVTNNNPGLPTATVSPNELLRRKNLGLCFLCEEKWTRGHKCKDKKLYMLVADEDSSNQDFAEVEEEVSEEGEKAFAISLQALSGTLHHSTMRLRGTLQLHNR